MFTLITSSDKPATLDDIITGRQDLADESYIAYKGLLWGIANYFLQTRPSRLENEYIMEVESLLDELYFRALEENWPTEVEERILNALNEASYLNEIVEEHHPGTPRGYNFGKHAKELGKILRFFVNRRYLWRKGR